MFLRQNQSSTDVYRPTVHSTKSQLVKKNSSDPICSRLLRSADRDRSEIVRINRQTVLNGSAEDATDDRYQKLLQFQSSFKREDREREPQSGKQTINNSIQGVEGSERVLATIEDDSISSPASTNNENSTFCFKNLITLNHRKQNKLRFDSKTEDLKVTGIERFDYEQLSMKSLRTRGKVSGTFSLH